MKIAIIGGGPSGLYFALLAKQSFPKAQVEVFEQNPRGATYGFGIALADRGLTRLERAHPESCAAILSSCYSARHQIVSHRNEAVFIERKGFSGAIARLRLLEILEDFCRRTDIPIIYGSRIGNLSAFADHDLVVGADGVNSVVRGVNEEAFGTTSWNLSNRMAWYGTKRHFPYPILSFKTTEYGHFWCAAYPYTETMSTFVAECDAAAWENSGLEKMDALQAQHFSEAIFSDELEGQALIANKSEWRCLPVIRNSRWSVGRQVLIGDALHSAHPTIGSGTRIAMEDAIDLAEALRETDGNVLQALENFERMRRPSKQKLVDAAEKSFTWYEDVAQKMDSLEPAPFVFDFLTRTGRISEARLREEFPRFLNRYALQWTAFKNSQSGSALLRARGVIAS